MKILVTGPRGFIASRLIEDCKAKGHHEVVTLDRDLKSEAFLTFFEQHRFDAVVHLATLFLKSHSFDQIGALVESNLTLTTQLLEASKQTGVKKFVTFGSFYEFPIPVTLYAATKAAMNPILDYFANNTPLEITELSIYDSYGPGDQRVKVLNVLIQAGRKGGDLPLSPGEQKIKLTHVADIVSAIHHALTMERPANHQSKVAHFAIEPPDAFTLKEIVGSVEKALKVKISAIWGAQAYLPGVQMNPSLPYPPLPGWKAQISLDQGLVEVVKT